MLVPGRVTIMRIAINEEDSIFASESMSMQMYKFLSAPNLYTSMQWANPPSNPVKFPPCTYMYFQLEQFLCGFPVCT